MGRDGREVWAKRVERWKESGLTAGDYAAEVGISERSLRWWKWRLATPEETRTRARRPAERVASPLTFIEVTPPVTSEGLEVVLKHGRSVRVPVGFDGPTFERLLALLERGS